jgi:hypothetical protein
LSDHIAAEDVRARAREYLRRAKAEYVEGAMKVLDS